jgi:hypothetical protein
MGIEKYYRTVKNIACNGNTEAIGSDREDLDGLVKQLKLSREESEVIESEVFQPFRQYEKELIKLVTAKFPLDDVAYKRLKDLRMSLNLLDKDVEVMEAQIVEEKKTLDVWIKLVTASEVSTIASLGGVGLSWLGFVAGSVIFSPLPAVVAFGASCVGSSVARSKVEAILKRRRAWKKFGNYSLPDDKNT